MDAREREPCAGMARRCPCGARGSRWLAPGAIAFGLPVVATGADGLPDVVEEGGNGLLIPPARMGAPTDARMRERLGKRAQARVQGLASEGIVAECWSTIHSEHELELLRCA